MLVRFLLLTLFLVICAMPAVVAQDAAAVVAAASKAMGTDNLNAIAFIGRARIGAFGQSKSIGDPMGAVNVTSVADYRRAINFSKPDNMTAPVSRATGTSFSTAGAGRSSADAGTVQPDDHSRASRSRLGTGPEHLGDPVGLPESRDLQQSDSKPAGQSAGRLVFSCGFHGAFRLELHGDWIHQQSESRHESRDARRSCGCRRPPGRVRYSGYQNMNGLQVPTRVVQRQAGLRTFDATIESATANPPTLAELLAPSPAAGAPAPAAAQPSAAPPVERIGDGVFKIGGNYVALAVDMGDHVLVVESGQSDARGMAVMAAARQAIPNKPIRFVVNSHAHFDHASGLGAAVAEGATILTHRNNEQVLERLLSGSRSLIGDSLSKVTNRRANVVEGVGDRDVRKGTNGKIVELHRISNEHSDGMLAVLLPAEKVLWTADITVVNPNPIQLATLRASVAALNRLKLDYDAWIPAHPPNPDRPLKKADVLAAAGTN